MKSFMFGKTSQGLAIPAYSFGRTGPEVLILGGVHGDETEGVIGAHALLACFLEDFTLEIKLTIVPAFNLDGVLAKQRKNGRGVDLNRNLPTNDWTNNVKEERYYPGPSANSEPENRALVNWLTEFNPQFVLSLHSWKPLLNVNGDCVPEAQMIARFTGYEVTPSIGYPTPGCLGTYCGLERSMPTLTYEFERGLTAEPIVKTHVPAIIEALKVTQTRRQ